ncbi:MAG: cobalamin-dependent protein, partial [Lentisphaeria bacterium]|nr:cobalamin-dependent protein [Lentisphaeria bacterium]
HDIGKNIASVVLQCNNYKIIDLGVMVPAETILDTAEKENVDMIALSGLITPSLAEMVNVASEMERRKMKIPLILGGATTSQVHTALKVAPAYPSGMVLQVQDASQGVFAVNSILNPKTRDASWKEICGSYEKIRLDSEIRKSAVELLPYAECCKNAYKGSRDKVKCGDPGIFKGIADFREIDPEEAFARIDWSAFRRVWADMENTSSTLQADAEDLFRTMKEQHAVCLNGSMGFFPAWSEDETLFCRLEDGSIVSLPMFRQQFPVPAGKPHLSLADYFPQGENSSETTYCGFFAVGCSPDPAFEASLKGDDYKLLLMKTLADRLAESCASLLQEKALHAWQNVADPVMIRPAPGYPALPDHTLKRDIFEILSVEKKFGFSLTEHYMMMPSSAVCGLLICHPEAKYFAVGRVGSDQMHAYAERRKLLPEKELTRFIAWQERLA